MKSLTLLVIFLAVLGTFGLATATAQPNEPSFFAVAGFGDFVSPGQPVAIKLVDLALGEVNQFFVCRDPQGTAVCFEPLPSGSTFVDTIPAQSAGKTVVYQIAKVGGGLGGTTDWGYVKAQVGYTTTTNPVVGTATVRGVEPLIIQCQTKPGTYCPAVWITEPNWFRIQTAGNYPAGTTLFVLATAKDGSVAARSVRVESTYTNAEISYVIPRVTYRRSPTSLTEFEVSSRTFRTLPDVIGPVVPNPSLLDR